MGYTPIGKTASAKLVDKFKRLIFGTYPVQKCIQMAAITVHKLSRLSETTAALFDDDSPSAEAYRARAASLRVTRDRICKYSLTVITWSWDFSWRRKAWREVRRTARSATKKFKETRKWLKDRQAAQNLTGYQEAEMLLFKKPLILELDEVGEELEALGSFLFSVEETSVEILREYIQRRLQGVLNERRIGDNFSFMEGGDPTDPFAIPKEVPRKTEKGRYAKDFIVFKIDPKTQDGSNYVQIKWDKKEAFVPLEPFDGTQDLLVKRLIKERNRAGKANKDPFDSDDDSEDSEDEGPQIPDAVLLKQLMAQEKEEREHQRRLLKKKEARAKLEEEANELALQKATTAGKALGATGAAAASRGGLYG
jgi:hypothetical protein